AVVERGVREALPRLPGGPDEAACREPARGRDGGALREEQAGRRRHVRQIQRGGGGVRGRALRGDRVLPPLGRLHHVHPRGLLLCPLPPGARAGNRYLRTLSRARRPAATFSELKSYRVSA